MAVGADAVDAICHGLTIIVVRKRYVVPFCQSSCNTSPNVSLNKILRRADPTLNKIVQQAVVESCQQRRGQTALCK